MSGAPSRDRQLRLLSAIVCVAAIADYGIIAATLPFFVTGAGATASTFTWLYAVYTLGQMLGNVGRGRLADRFGRKPALVAGVAGSALSMALLLSSGSLATLFAARFLAGIFNGTQVAAAIAASDLSDPGGRTRNLSRIEAANNLGWYLIGTLAGGYLARWGFVWAFGLSLALGIVNCVVALVFFRETRTPIIARTGAAARAAGGPGPYRVIFASRPLWASIALVGLFGIAAGAAQSCYPLFLRARFGFDPFAVSALLSLSGLLLFVSQTLFIGPLARRLGEFRLIAVASVASAVAVLIYGPVLSAVASVPLLVLGVLFWGTGTSAQLPAATSILSAHAPADHKGAVLGFMRSVFYLSKLSAPVAGWMFDRYGAAAPFNLMIAAFAASGMLSYWVARRPQPRNQPATASREVGA